MPKFVRSRSLLAEPIEKGGRIFFRERLALGRELDIFPVPRWGGHLSDTTQAAEIKVFSADRLEKTVTRKEVTRP